MTVQTSGSFELYVNDQKLCDVARSKKYRDRHGRGLLWILISYSMSCRSSTSLRRSLNVRQHHLASILMEESLVGS